MPYYKACKQLPTGPEEQCEGEEALLTCASFNCCISSSSRSPLGESMPPVALQRPNMKDVGVHVTPLDTDGFLPERAASASRKSGRGLGNERIHTRHPERVPRSRLLVPILSDPIPTPTPRGGRMQRASEEQIPLAEGGHRRRCVGIGGRRAGRPDGWKGKVEGGPVLRVGGTATFS